MKEWMKDEAYYAMDKPRQKPESSVLTGVEPMPFQELVVMLYHWAIEEGGGGEGGVIQLDIEVQRTQTTEMNKHDYSVSFVCVLLTSLSSWIYREEPIVTHAPQYRGLNNVYNKSTRLKNDILCKVRIVNDVEWWSSLISILIFRFFFLCPRKIKFK